MLAWVARGGGQHWPSGEGGSGGRAGVGGRAGGGGFLVAGRHDGVRIKTAGRSIPAWQEGTHIV